MVVPIKTIESMVFGITKINQNKDLTGRKHLERAQPWPPGDQLMLGMKTRLSVPGFLNQRFQIFARYYHNATQTIPRNFKKSCKEFQHLSTFKFFHWRNQHFAHPLNSQHAAKPKRRCSRSPAGRLDDVELESDLSSLASLSSREDDDDEDEEEEEAIWVDKWFLHGFCCGWLGA